nr:hypothetical protein [uncultured Kingella sp.]
MNFGLSDCIWLGHWVNGYWVNQRQPETPFLLFRLPLTSNIKSTNITQTQRQPENGKTRFQAAFCAAFYRPPCKFPATQQIFQAALPD